MIVAPEGIFNGLAGMRKTDLLPCRDIQETVFISMDRARNT